MIARLPIGARAAKIRTEGLECSGSWSKTQPRGGTR